MRWPKEACALLARPEALEPDLRAARDWVRERFAPARLAQALADVLEGQPADAAAAGLPRENTSAA